MLTQTEATLNATVNPNGSTVSDCRFEYGTTTAYGSNALCSQSPGSGSTAVPVSAPLTGLGANTTYHFRISATNGGGPSHGSDQTLTTLPNQPTVATGAASAIAQTFATLNATVNPNGAVVTDCHFDYGLTTSYGSTVPCTMPPGSGTSAVAVSAPVEGLVGGATYFFRIVAANAGGTSLGAAQALTTQLPTTLTPQGPAPQGPAPQGPSSPPTRTSQASGAKLASTSLRATASGNISVTLTCPAGVSNFTGTITLKTLTAVVASTGHQAKRPRASILTLATGSFRFTGGCGATIRLHLSTKARRLLLHRRVLRARAIIVAHDSAGTTYTSQAIVTIRLASRRRG
jgi:hypothetical protein